jgi:hypothetical protein
MKKIKKSIQILLLLIIVPVFSQEKIDYNKFLGNWSDAQNLNLSITMATNNDAMIISYFSGPCQGKLIGKKSKENNIIELTHSESECNYLGFDNSHILKKKIGKIDLINEEIVLDLKIGDDLLIVGKMFLFKDN